MKEVRHSMDEVFQQKLGSHSLDPPMHIWEKIQQKRNWQYRLWLRIKRQWPWIVIALLSTGLLGLLLWQKAQSGEEIEIDALPIPMQPVAFQDQWEETIPPVHSLEQSFPQVPRVEPVKQAQEPFLITGCPKLFLPSLLLLNGKN